MRNLLTTYVNSFRAWFGDIPAAQRFSSQYPGIASFVSGRFDPKSFIGLPLTLILLASCVNILLFSELAESVIEAEWIVLTDKSFTNLLYSIRSEELSSMLYMCTLLGEREAVFIVGGIVTVVWLYRRRFTTIVGFWVAMAGVGLSVRYVKTFISRARPADVAYYEVVHYSFPSGHATTAMALYGLLAYLAYRHNQHMFFRKFLPWLAVLFIVLVGFSRIYLGVHYLTDVLAGFLLGALWLLVGVSIIEMLEYRKKKKHKI